MPASEIDSKERHGGGRREEDIEMSENIRMRERSREGVHSQIRHLLHVNNGGRDRASQMIVTQSPDDAGE